MLGNREGQLELSGSLGPSEPSFYVYWRSHGFSGVARNLAWGVQLDNFGLRKSLINIKILYIKC